MVYNVDYVYFMLLQNELEMMDSENDYFILQNRWTLIKTGLKSYLALPLKLVFTMKAGSEILHPLILDLLTKALGSELKLI